jgi:hypothetical protein
MRLNLKDGGPSTPDSRRHRRRRFWPLAEPLEARAVPALGFTAAFGLAANLLKPEHVAIDAAGNTYLTGSFLGAANFDPSLGPAGALKTGAGNGDTFVAKYSSDGALVWVRQFATLSSSSTTTNGSFGAGIAVAPGTGTVYVVGEFTGTVDFDAGGTPMVLTSASTMGDGYIIALTPGGAVTPGLVQQFGSATGNAEFDSVTLSGDGTSVFVTGAFTGTLDFDPAGTNAKATLMSPTNGTSEDAFMLALTNKLSFIGVGQLNLGTSEGFGIAVDGSGSVFIVGPIHSTTDGFAARFDASGGLVTDRAFLGTHPTTMADTATSVVSDGTNLYVAGTFRGNEVNFNATSGTAAATLDSRGDSDAFLLKLDASLSLVWARRFGSPNADAGTGLAIDGSGNLYLTGFVSGLSSFGTTGLGTVIFSPGNGISATPDTFVLQVDKNGNSITPVGPQGDGTATASSIAANSAGQVVVVGNYSGTAIFTTAPLQVPGTLVPFVATLGDVSSSGGGGGGGGSGGNGNGGSGPILPALVGARRVISGTGRKKTITGIELVFSAPLDAVAAAEVSHYLVTQPGRTRHSGPRLIPVLAAQAGQGGGSVTLILGRFNAARRLSVSATGLRGADGSPLATIVTRV